MKEIQEIIAALKQIKRTTNKVALATLVKVEGSTYRRPGARMLISANGVIAGAISGGCLESDVVEKAQEVMDLGKSRLVKYDTTSEEDLTSSPSKLLTQSVSNYRGGFHRLLYRFPASPSRLARRALKSWGVMQPA